MRIKSVKPVSFDTLLHHVAQHATTFDTKVVKNYIYGDFLWSSCNIAGKKVALLGYTFSIWRNIAGNVIQEISPVISGKHITLYPTLAETKNWLNKTGKKFTFIDPKTGHKKLLLTQKFYL